MLSFFERFPRSRVVFEDEDIVAVDKPCGLSTHAAEKGRADDLVSWLATDYAARELSTYLGIHQRLDKDTSGLVVFARRKEANPKLAEQFERRLVEKEYVAVVHGRIPDRGRLDHWMSDGRTERRETRPFGGKPRHGEQSAHASFEVLERRGRESLLALKLETGRTHQLRAQLSAIKAPIVGDTLYDGPPSRRVMLHARSLTLTHPTGGKKLTLTAEPPPSFRGERLGLAEELEVAAARRVGIPRAGETTAFRLVHGEADGFADLTVDVYDGFGVVSLYRAFDPAELAEHTDALSAFGLRGLYVKHRPKHASRIVDSRRDDVAPKLPIVGEPAPDPLIVHEHGVPLEVRLGDGLSTGVFLDQRENRARVRDLARGKSVLNLFAYTGAFTVAAVMGGARESTTVDASPTVVDWARRNLDRVSADPALHKTAVLDVFEFLARMKARGASWDLVIVDPPSFSTTKRSTFSAESEYAKLAARCFEVLAPGGVLLACTNHKSIHPGKFRRLLHDGARAAGVTVTQMKEGKVPADFPPLASEGSHLKSLFVTRA